MEFSISKARCQYETYNEQEKASSRFVFAIHEFEIRDRLLARSEINKFLYLYTTEAAPRRTHADMVRKIKSDVFFLIKDYFFLFSWL
jgi:autophagy-related protein 2